MKLRENLLKLLYSIQNLEDRLSWFELLINHSAERKIDDKIKFYTFKTVLKPNRKVLQKATADTGTRPVCHQRG